MLLPKFDFIEPHTIQEVCLLLSQYTKDAMIIAGGTDLLVNLKKKAIKTPKQIISIGKIRSLQKIDREKDTIKIGTSVSVADIIESKEINKDLLALQTASMNLGSSLVRNRATIGGNIISARPAADLPAPLIAFGAKIEIQSNIEKRIDLLENIFKGPGLTTLKPNELLTHIILEIPPKRASASYASIGIRKSQDCNIVNVCSYIYIDSNNNIKKVRIVLGSVSPTHIRAKTAEEFLLEKKIDSNVIDKAGEMAYEDCSPIDDFRASASYKKDMVKALTKRTLTEACNKVLKKKIT